MPRAGTPLLVGVLFHELQGRTGVRERGKRSLEDEVGRLVQECLRDAERIWRGGSRRRLGDSENCGYNKRDFWRISFQGGGGFPCGGQNARRRKIFGESPFLRRLPVLVALVRVLFCQGDGEGGGQAFSGRGKEEAGRRSRATCGRRGHVAVAGGLACPSNTAGICTFQ